MRPSVALCTVGMLVACTEKPSKPREPEQAATYASDAAMLAAAKEAEAVAAGVEAGEEAGLEAGVEAVTYGLPIVMMDLMARQITNYASPSALGAPVNQFAHVPTFPDPSFKGAVRPNVDMLSSSAVLDLSKEPIVLSVPDTKGRYYLMPMLDAWTNVFASPGKRTTGTKEGHFAITGPGWSGTLPKGLDEIKSPTNLVWIVGQTQTNGPKDYPDVHAIQEGYQLVPLSAFGKPYTLPKGAVEPAVDMKTPPAAQLAKMSSTTYFNLLASLMRASPPPPEDTPVLAKMAKIGLVPGQRFDPGKLDPSFAKGLEKAVTVALDKLPERANRWTRSWSYPPQFLGKYGTQYDDRAALALVGLGANVSPDAVYFTAAEDEHVKGLNGGRDYVIHFDKGELPSVNAFWSVTMYDAQSFLVPNPIDRYAISSWMPLKRNQDGSLDLYLQQTSPGKDLEPNWLPAAAGAFSVMLRMYWPKDPPPSNLGGWRPPGVDGSEDDWRRFIQDQSAANCESLKRSFDGCTSEIASCAAKLTPNEAVWNRLLELIDQGQECAIEIGFLFWPYTDGGDLEDTWRSLGGAVESKPALILSLIEKYHVSGGTLDLLCMLPFSTVDDDKAQLTELKLRMRRVAGVTEPALSAAKAKSLAALQKCANPRKDRLRDRP
jgi:hypothetical protein